MANAEALLRLREQIGETGNIDKETWAAPHLACGVAKGIVVELSGNGRIEWLLEFFKLHPDTFIFWCEREQSVNPTAIYQRGIDLKRILFANVADDLQKILHRTLEGGQYPFIIAPNRAPDVRSMQRLHLLAGKVKSTVFLLAEKDFSQAWPISLQAEINFDGTSFKVDVHRQKYGGST